MTASVTSGGSVDVASFGDLLLQLTGVAGDARIASTGPMAVSGSAAGDVRLVSYSSLQGAVHAGHDLWAYAIGTIIADLSAGNMIDTVATYSSLGGTVSAPVVRGVYIWDDLIGSVTALVSIGEVYVGDEIAPGALVSAPAIGLVAEHDRSAFIDDPAMPYAAIGEVVSVAKNAYTQLLDLQTSLAESKAELHAMVAAAKADAGSVLAQAADDLADAMAEGNALLADIGVQGKLAADKAKMAVDWAILEVTAELDAGRREALDASVALKQDAGQSLEALKGEAAARLSQGEEEHEFLQNEAARARQRFEAIRAAQLEQIDALKATYPLIFAATFVDAFSAADAALTASTTVHTVDLENTYWAGIKGWYAGSWQGVLNIINGLQDTAIGVCNLPAMGINAIAWVEEKVGILDPNDPLRIPYIPSPDWSRGMVTEEYAGGSWWSDTHAWSKFLGASGVEILAGVWWSKVGAASKAAKTGVGCFELGTLVADGGEYGTQYVATAEADSGLYWALTVGALAAAGFVYGASRHRRKQEEEDRLTLHDILGSADDNGSEPEDLDLLALDVTKATGRPRETASDRVLAASEALFDRADVRCAVLDKPAVKRTIKGVGQAFQRDTVRESAPRMSTTTRTKPRSSASHRFSVAWPVIGLLLLVAGFFGFQAIRASSEPAREKVTFRSSPDVRFINGVPFRPIENYEPCDRVLGENPLLTAKDRAGFGREPDPKTWKLLYVLAPKVDGSWAETKMVKPPEWLEEHKPEVGKTVPIWVPECGIQGMAEVVSIGPSRPVKPGKGPVVLATFRHHVASTVNVYISGVAEPIGCTGNHPFWSEDRQAFLRADELREGERLDGFGADARVERVVIDARPQIVFNLMVQGEHVYRVSRAGVLVHNAVKCPVLIRYGSKAEMEATKEARGLAARPGHPNNPKRILEPGGPSRPPFGSKKSDYAYQMTLRMKNSRATRQWLEKNAKPIPGHADGWAIPNELLNEFNTLIDTITFKKIF